MSVDFCVLFVCDRLLCGVCRRVFLAVCGLSCDRSRLLCVACPLLVDCCCLWFVVSGVLHGCALFIYCSMFVCFVLLFVGCCLCLGCWLLRFVRWLLSASWRLTIVVCCEFGVV